MTDLLAVPEDVARTARAALHTRAERGQGGTARGVTIATALTTGVVTGHELDELHAWHRDHPDEVKGDASTMLAGLYGGRPARVWVDQIQPYEADVEVAAVSGMEGAGAMVALTCPSSIAERLAVSDGEPADNMHVTLFFLGKSDDLAPAEHVRIADRLRAVTPTMEPVALSFTHLDVFPANEDGISPVVLVTGAPAVYDLRERLRQALGDIEHSDRFAFHPHLTLGYWPADALPAGMEPGPLPAPVEWTADQVALVWGDSSAFYPLTNRQHADPWTQPVTAALARVESDRLAGLSRTLNQTDQRLRVKLHAAAQVALAEAVRAATVKLNQKARNNAQRAALNAADGRYPPALVAALGVTEQELLDKRFDELALAAEGWIVTAELRKLRATARALGVEPDDQWEDEIDRRAHTAAGFLAAGVALLARARLAGDIAGDALGEQAGPVPFSLVRSTWALGATNATAPLRAETGPGPVPTTPIPRVEPGTTLAGQLLTDTNVPVIVRSTWVHGDPARTFEPHQALDGVTWVDTQPDELAADPAAFPYVDVYQPGDHDGCTCTIEESYEPYTTGPTAELESLSV